MTHILVFDIETIPDLASARKLYQLEDLTDHDVFQALKALRREKVGHDFLPHHLQQIIAISLVYANNNNIKVWSLGEETSPEKELIERFFAGIDKFTPTLISWNGAGFDLPVLNYRAMLHQVAAPTFWEVGEQSSLFKWNNYLNRFHYRHLDLMDVLALYQNKAFAPLDEIATMLGFPGKMGMSGAKVFEQYTQGNLTEIRNYCETDVLNTYCVYLRFELMRGKLSPANYLTQLQNLKTYLLSDATKPHWQEFVQKIA
ncbi:MAG: 3'-5' exonuclease [Legionellales bacterium RIFCSPHIGHO2_12_FULL_37_14]|nr:MAG: 3'-5' exonuclease [Legionellales bacterium RIFCSPHIGHO2_12_FULL_37_14]